MSTEPIENHPDYPELNKRYLWPVEESFQDALSGHEEGQDSPLRDRTALFYWPRLNEAGCVILGAVY